MSEENTIILMRMGELFLKGQNRHQFVDRLKQNVQRSLRQWPNLKVRTAQGRLFVSGEGCGRPNVVRTLRRTFGVQSLSVAHRAEHNLDQIARAAISAAKEYLEAHPAKTFAVRARRSYKRFPHASPEIAKQVGHAVGEATGIAVDLEKPDLAVGVEVGEEAAYIFCDRVPCGGGLPTGTGGRVLLLLSGGIDSPVAGHLLQKRGCELECLYFHSPPHTSEHAKDKVIQLAERLTLPQGILTLHTVTFTHVQEAIRDKAPESAVVVLYRRMMMRIACYLADQRKIQAIAHG